VSTMYSIVGQNFRLSQAALELRIFTVSELESITGIGENTIYGFLSQLGANNLQSKELPSEGRGRPRKRYWLTEAGMAWLAKQNSQILSSLGNLPMASGRKLDQLREESLTLSVAERRILISQLQESMEEEQAPANGVYEMAESQAAPLQATYSSKP
jgi:DNA-binding PadR family transcriptional regulator